MKKYLNYALNICKNLGAEFSDIRIIETKIESIGIKNGKIENLSYNESRGFGIRILYNGGWGFASYPELSNDSIKMVAERAMEIAKATSLLLKNRVILAEEDIYEDYWNTPIQKDPFLVPIDEKIEILKKADAVMRKDKKIKVANSSMRFIKETKYYANSEGTNVTQVFYISGGGISNVAAAPGIIQVRSYPQSFNGQFAQLGFELIESLKLSENAEKIREEAIALLSAKKIEPGKRDLIIIGSQLGLQIHESLGHPSELDRVLGIEENFAGSSFITIDKYKGLKYGSDIVNLVADSTAPTGLGTFGYDDDGVKSQRFYIVKNGIYQGYLTNRELARVVGDKRSKGCSRAESYNAIPIIRMINISLLPGDKSLEEIISSTEDGILVDGIKTWSIDQQRINFQFTTEIGWEIKNGQIKNIVRDPTYQGITTEFWNNCDAIANESIWKLWGVMNCGKGQPMQVMRMSHGASAARFKNTMVF